MKKATKKRSSAVIDDDSNNNEGNFNIFKIKFIQFSFRE